MTPAPSALDLAKMHATEFKHHREQLEMVHRLIEQIMIGRVVTVGPDHDRRYTVTKVIAKGTTIFLYGKTKGSRARKLISHGLDFVTIVQPEPAST